MKDVKKLIASHILRDFVWYEKERTAWSDQLYRLSKQQDVALSPPQTEALVKVLSHVAKDDSEAIRRQTLFTVSNLSKKSTIFIEKCVEMGVFEMLILSFWDYDAASQMAVLDVAASYCKQCKSEEVVYCVIKLGLMDLFMSCLASGEDYLVVGVARALYEAASHIKLAQDMAAKGALEVLALLLMDDLRGDLARTLPALAVVRRASEHGLPLAAAVVRSGCLALANHYLHHPALEFKKMALGTIMNIGLNNVNYIVPLLGSHLFTDLITLLTFPDVEMKFYAANLIRTITERSPKLRDMMVENGLLEALIFSIQTKHYNATPSYISLANVLKASLLITKQFIVLKGHLILSVVLHQDSSEFAVFSIMQIFLDIFKRGTPYNSLIANMDIYIRLVELYREPASTRFLRRAISDCCRQLLQDCTDWALISGFFAAATHKQVVFVLRHFSKVLPYSVQHRKKFLDLGGLEKVCRLSLSDDDPQKVYLDIIKSCFPQDAVNYFNPQFEKSIMQRVKDYAGTNPDHRPSLGQAEERPSNVVEEVNEKFTHI